MFGICEKCGYHLTTHELDNGAIVLACKNCANNNVTDVMPKIKKSTDAEWRQYYRDQRDKEIADLIEDMVFNHVTPELEEKLPIKILRNILQSLRKDSK